MTYNTFTNKWTIGAITLLIIIAAGCILYYQRTTAVYKSEVRESDKLIKQWYGNKQLKPLPPAETEITQAPAEIEIATTEEPITATIQDNETSTIIADLTVDIPIKEESRRISKYGFGEYPVVPVDFPLAHPRWDIFDKTDELTYRVLIKAWNNGERFVSARTEANGKIFLNYPNTVYVQHIKTKNSDGTISEVRNVSGPPGIPVPPLGKDFPPYIRVLDPDTHGIDPYEYLDIPN